MLMSLFLCLVLLGYLNGLFGGGGVFIAPNPKRSIERTAKNLHCVGIPDQSGAPLDLQRSPQSIGSALTWPWHVAPTSPVLH
jgi:hypothetical protein